MSLISIRNLKTNSRISISILSLFPEHKPMHIHLPIRYFSQFIRHSKIKLFSTLPLPLTFHNALLTKGTTTIIHSFFLKISIYIAASGLIMACRLSCIWDLGSLGQTHIPCTARWILNTGPPGKPLYHPFSTQAKSLIIILKHIPFSFSTPNWQPSPITSAFSSLPYHFYINMVSISVLASDSVLLKCKCYLLNYSNVL